MGATTLWSFILFATLVSSAHVCTDVQWGTFIDAYYSSSLVNSTIAFDTAAGRPSQIVHLYVNWDDGYQGPNGNDFNYYYEFPGIVNRVRNFNSVGLSTHTPLISWQPWRSPYNAQNNYYSYAGISNGNFDTYIDSFFKVLKNLGGPFFVRPFHEFDGDWYPWGAGNNGNTGAGFIAMWRHLKARLDLSGATNVSLVWCPNNANSKGIKFEDYYPGDSYVHWVGLDAYANSIAVQFPDTIGRNAAPQYPYQRMTNMTSKPIMIAEFGAIPTHGTYDYGSWIQTATASLASLPQIKAMVFFNSRDFSVDLRNTSMATMWKNATTGGTGSCSSLSPIIVPSAPNDLRGAGEGEVLRPLFMIMIAMILMCVTVY